MDHSKRRAKLQNAMQDIKACHSMLWPGVEVPDIQKVDVSSNDGWINLVPTSLLVAVLTWAVTAPKRSPDFRRLAAEVLAALIKYTCRSAAPVSVAWVAVNTDGVGPTLQGSVGGSFVLEGLLGEQMSDAISLAWDSDFMEPSKPYPSSPRRAPSIQDFILWSLEPMPLNNKDETLRKNKALLATQARSLLTQIAVALDTRSLFKLFNPGPDDGPDQDDDGHGIGRFDIMYNAGTKRRRLTTLAVNSVAAPAAQRLFDGKARGFVELKIVAAVFFHVARTDGLQMQSWR